MTQSGKKSKPSRPAGPRNPFAGRPRSGAGYHEQIKYGKKERRRKGEEIDSGLGEESRPEGGPEKGSSPDSRKQR